MTSEEPHFGGSGKNMATASSSNGIMTSSSDSDVAYEVPSLKALSLNGVNERVGHALDKEGDEDPTLTMSLEPSDPEARPKPRLSWGSITDLPDGDAGESQEVPETRNVNTAWLVKSTQNPSRPLVRRPTPMTIKIPTSVLGKGLSRMTTDSFEEGDEEEEEEEEIEEENNDAQVPVSKRGSNDVLIVEDVINEEEEEEGEEARNNELFPPNDLPVKPSSDNVTPLTTQQSLDTGSPTIVVQTTIGKHLSVDEAEELENDNDIDDVDENDNQAEESEVGIEKASLDPAEQFLSPNVSESYKKKTLQPPKNNRAQSSPTQKKKLVRKQTPISLDLPKEAKCFDSLKKNSEILEEEEQEEETQQEDIAGDVNCNNNHGVKSSADLVDGADILTDGQISHPVEGARRKGFIRKAASCDGRLKRQNLSVDDGSRVQSSSGGLGGNGRFRKSASCDKSDGRRSPLTTKAKVSPHHTKILTRQQTPIDLHVPQSVLAEIKKSNAAIESFDENQEEVGTDFQ